MTIAAPAAPTASPRRAPAVLGLALFVLLLAPACGSRTDTRPALGAVMGHVLERHSKTWLAGQAGNWPLAEFEIRALRDALGDATRHHPTHGEQKLPIAALVPQVMDGPLRELEGAARAQDGARFAKAFDATTAACNACHHATSRSFLVVQRPAANPFPGMSFEPGAPR